MNTNDKLSILKARLARLNNNPKDIKCPGVIRKVTRQVRNGEKVGVNNGNDNN